MDVLVKNICYGNIDKSLWCYDEQNHENSIKYKHTVNTAVDPMPIDKIPLDILFVSSV